MNEHLIRLYGSNSELDHTFPVPIFGSWPSKGSYLVIRIKDLLKHRTEFLKLEIKWLGLPDNLNDYYKEYEPDYLLGNQSYLVNFSIGFSDKYYQINKIPLKLFDEDTSGFISPKSTFQLEIQNIVLLNPELERNGNLEDEFDGKLKMTLISPEVAFGHSVFPKLYSETIMKNERFFMRILKQKINLPNPPIIPIAKEVTIYSK